MKALLAIVLLVAASVVAWSAGVFAGDDAPPVMPARDVATDDAPGGATDGVREIAVSPERHDVSPAARARSVRITTVNTRGEIVSGAEVRYWPPGSRGERERLALLAGVDDVEAVLRSGGRTAVTDARGIVEIEADERSSVAARKDDSYGQALLGSADARFADELRIVLQHDVSVTAEVVDEEGRPVAEQVVAIQASFGSHWNTAGARAVVFTASDGVATLAHALQALAWPDHAANGQLRFACEVAGAKLVLAERTESFDPTRPLERVRLVVPSAGTIRVTTTDADGTVLEPDYWLEDGNGDFRRAVRIGDRSLFPHVPFGVRWTLVMRGETFRHRRVIEGPDVRNPVVHVVTKLPVRAIDLRARVVRSDGAPVAGAKITWKCEALAFAEVEAVTDERGAIPFGRLQLQRSVAQGAGLTIAVASPHIVPRTFEIGRKIAPGTTDLGDLVVEPAKDEVLLASVELRCDGAPVRAGGWATLHVAERADGGEPTAMIHGNNRRRMSSRAPAAATPAQHDVATFVRRRGDVIELRGRAVEGSLLLHCGHPDCVTVRDVAVVVGEHEVVELQRAAALRLSLLLPDLPRNRISGTLTRLGERNGKVTSLDVAQQQLAFDDVAPGGYSLRVEIDGCVLYETASIVLAAGDNRWPRDGAPLDLRHAARMIAIDAREAGTGEQIDVDVVDVPTGSMAAVEWRGPHVLPDRVDEAGGQWHVLPARPVDLLVRASGYVPVRVIGPTQDVALQLQRATFVEFDAGDVADAKVRVRIVDDAVRDDALRSFDQFNSHRQESEFPLASADEASRFINPWNPVPGFVPGTVLEVALVRDGTPGPPQRVVVGNTSPQRVTLR